MYWLLCREVLRLRGDISRQKEWETMVDMFVYRDPEEADKQDEQAKQAPFGNWPQEQHDDQGDYADQPASGFGNQDSDWGAPGTGEWGADGEDH